MMELTALETASNVYLCVCLLVCAVMCANGSFADDELQQRTADFERIISELQRKIQELEGEMISQRQVGIQQHTQAPMSHKHIDE